MRTLPMKWRLFITMFVAVSLLASLPLKIYATDSGTDGANESVTEDTKGVICILVSYEDEDKNLIPIQSGTGFLINEETVITCAHVIAPDDETIAILQEMYDKKVSEIKENIRVEVIVNRDVRIPVDSQLASAEMDYAILTLGTTLFDRTCLPIRHSSEVIQTEKVYALGFPGQVGRFQDVNHYTTDDVTVTDGKVSKVCTLSNGVEYVLHSAILNSGNSGGPLVDDKGRVIGINAFSTGGIYEENYFYAIAIDELITTLNSLGIEYTLVEASEDETGEEGQGEGGLTGDGTDETVTAVDKTRLTIQIELAKRLDPANYTEESYEELEEALEEAETVASDAEATQEQVDSALSRLDDANNELVEAPFPIVWVIVIASAVLVLIIVIVIIVVSSKKKKAAAPTYAAPVYNPAGAPSAPAARAPITGFNTASNVPVTSFIGSGVGAGETSVLSAGAGETTVLNAGPSATSLLNSNINLGTLTRSKTGERITINSDNFVIGKELSKVNYCVSDNTSISRTHVRFTGRGGVTYITDLKTTNGTFLNGVKIQPNQENPLKSGDRISMADEEFTFSA